MAEFEVTILFKIEADSLAQALMRIPVLWDEQKYTLLGIEESRKEEE